MRQTQQQKQIQTTSAVQVMLSTIMEMPLADLEQYVSNEIDSNEALECGDSGSDTVAEYTPEDRSPGDEFGVRDSHTSQDDYDDFMTIDQVPEDMRSRYNEELSKGNGRAQYDGDTERQIADTGATSYDDITSQIGELNLTAEEQKVMEYLIGSLDERGYLAKDNQTLIDELLFQEYIDIDEPRLERLISLLQSFEPRGIGARDMRECLLLQMECPPDEKHRLSLVKRLAHKVVRDLWEELAHSRWKKIQDALDVDDETIADIQRSIRRLNPKPGSGLNESMQTSAPTVIPDFTVIIDDTGEPLVFQNRGALPELRVSSSFADIVDEYRAAQDRAKAEGRDITFSRSQEEAYKYANHKVDSAKAFIESIRRRRHTLQLVMEGIVREQRDFFVGDDDETLLHPMILRDVAEHAGVDISTVSRAVNSKFVQTAQGTYPLKFFFSSEFVNADGDSLSQRQVKNDIRRIIEDEDPRHPFSDQKITDMLAQQGTVIARRTVAKYREQLGFPTSALRRK